MRAQSEIGERIDRSYPSRLQWQVLAVTMEFSTLHAGQEMFAKWTFTPKQA